MIKLKTLTVKNFMSVGNVTQALNLEGHELTLVLGQNIDLGGDDAGSRNGTCLLYTSPSPRDRTRSRMPSSA